MSKKVTIHVGGGLSFASALTITFIILKLCNIITWSWWWVTAPIWLPIVASVGLIIALAIIAIVLYIVYLAIVILIKAIFSKQL